MNKKRNEMLAVVMFCITILLLSNFPMNIFSLKAKAERNASFYPDISINKENYTGNTGYEPWYYYIGGIINSANGNLYISMKDISIKARGFNIEIIRSYNTHNSNFSTAFGYGWTFNYNIYLIEKNNSILLIDGDGSFHTFESIGGGVYSPPPGKYYKLRKKHLSASLYYLM